MATDPIVLRESQDGSRRIVFLPTVIDQEDSLRGQFVYQRKCRGDQWEDIRESPLSSLRSGEGYVLELKSAEVTKLIQGLLERKELYEQFGINFGTRSFISRENLPQALREIADFPESELAAMFADLDRNDLLNLSQKVDLSKLELLLSEWRSNLSNGDEDFWHDLLKRNAWVFSQLTGSPVVLLKDKAYVGSKDISNRGGGEIDYLCQNELTHNVAFIEIKTPETSLASSAYRSSGSFAISPDVSGGVVQVLGYRDTFEKEFYAASA